MSDRTRIPGVRRRIGFLLLAALAALVGPLGCADEPTGNDPSPGEGTLPPGVDIVRLGAGTDATPNLHGPSLLLQGSGTPLDTAFRAHLAAVASEPVDVVVLAASSPAGESSTPECDALQVHPRVNSCTTLTLATPAAAGTDTAAATVRRAEVVYFAGGNQCEYVSWEGRGAHGAVRDVFERGGGVGGGSAGLAVQGEVVYDGCTGSVRSSEALTDPYHPRMSFTRDYFEWGSLDRLITDSHFQERDRMGRLIAFVARQIQDTGAASFWGLGVNEETAVVIDARGVGTVYGERAYVVHGDHEPAKAAPGIPLTYEGVKIVPLPSGSSYDFVARPLNRAYQRDVEAGTLSADPYHGK